MEYSYVYVPPLGINIYLDSGSARVVEFNGKRYTEGLLEATILELTDDVFEEMGQGRPN